MRTDRRETLIGRLILISHRRSAVATGDFPGIAEASEIAALAPTAANCVTSIGDSGEGYGFNRTVPSL